jgi:hypothetical protein
MSDWTIPRAAVIPTNGRECVNQCLDAILPQVDFVVLVENGEPVPARDRVYKFWVPPDTGINISAWWSYGLDEVRWRVNPVRMRSGPETGGESTLTRFLRVERRRWDVAVLNDDAIVPEGWFDAVAIKMREMKAAAASSCAHTAMPILYTKPGPVDLFRRMNGFAFILRGELDIRPEKRLTWYCSDDHMDWLARGLGGVVVVPGFPINHLYPNGQVTEQIQRQIAEDMQEFVNIWGQRPW